MVRKEKRDENKEIDTDENKIKKRQENAEIGYRRDVINFNGGILYGIYGISGYSMTLEKDVKKCEECKSIYVDIQNYLKFRIADRIFRREKVVKFKDRYRN